MNFKIFFILILITIYSCDGLFSPKESGPEDTCLAVWKAISKTDMETLSELSTADSQFGIMMLSSFLGSSDFFQFMEIFGFIMDSEPVSYYLNKKKLCL